jgi:hypothetical protein
MAAAFSPDGELENVLKAGQTLIFPNRAIHNEGAADEGTKANGLRSRRAGQFNGRLTLDLAI